MLPDDQPTVPTRPPNPSNATQPGVWVAPTVEELQAKLPQYEVLEILGRGGMGAVYKARQKSLKRLVAIKILPLGMADDEFKFVERFQNEAQTMAQMNHPAIVSVYDFGETSDGLLYFVMEFVDGTDVHKMIQASGRLSGEYALSITAHVCDALSYAHKRGVIHRDIKPANILIDQEGHIKVADFGLAKMHDPAQTSGLTRTNMAMGTPDYVAPEVLVTGMVADHRADIYAVGVMLYQMLTGEVPRGLFKLPSQKGIGSDERFDAIICKAMEQDREERYQSAMDVRRDLDVILTTPQPKSDGTGVVPANELPQKPVAKQPRPPGQQNAPAQNQPPAKGAAKLAPEQKPAAAAKAKAPPKKQSPAAMWMSIGGIVAVLGVAGFFVVGRKSEPNGDLSASKAGAEASTPATTTPEIIGKPTSVLGTTADGKSVTDIPPVDWLKSRWEAPWVLQDGKLKSTANDANRFFGGSRDGVVRVRFRPDAASKPDSNAPPLQFTFRFGRNGAEQGQLSLYQLQVFPARRSANLLFIQRSANKNQEVPTILWRERMLPPPVAGETEMELELRASGPDISVWSGATEVASVRDDRAQNGGWLVIANPGVEITTLETRLDDDKATASVPSATEPETLPAIKAWRDVTAEAREKAKAFPELAATDKGIENQANRSNPRLLLTPAGQRDQAVRIRFTGYGQVDLHLGDAGFLYVMAQPHQTIFQSQASGSSAPPVKLIPNKLHPPGYDPNQPHELLVTLEGTRLRAWLDGKFVGEAKADTLTEGVTGVIITPATILHQVELGEFAKTTTSGPPNMNWQDVTAKFREKARGLASVQLDADAVRLADGGPTSHRIILTPDGVNDFAVRVRYTGGVQIDRINSEGAFDFVMCQRKPLRVAFKRYTPSSGITEDIAATVPMPAGYDDTQQHEAVAMIEGPRIRLWVDGRFMGEARDERITSGAGSISLKAYTPIFKVEIADLTPNTPAGPPASNEAIDWLKRDVWSAPFALENGVLRSTSKDGEGRIGWAKDSTLRLRVRIGDIPDNTKPSLQCTVRSAQSADKSKRSYYLLQFFPKKRTCNLLYLEKDPSGKSISTQPLWQEVPFPGSAQEFEVEIRAEGDKLSLWSAGKEVVSARDARVPEGATRILASPGIEITRLETVGVAADAASSDPTPPSANWQDITATVREKAQKMSDLAVEADAVRLKPDSPAVTMPLDRGTAASLAVRLTHKGDGQVTWHSGENGMIYVLCQRTKTIFHRLPRGASAPTPIEPDVPHPEGFVHTAPHQLLMTQEGSRIAAWLDGRFIGEVRDEAFVRSIPQLYISKWGDVRKVEIAELTASSASAQAPPSSSAQTFNGHRYEFVSGSFTWPEAKAQAEQRGGHLAVITSAEEHNWAWKTFSDQLPPQPKDEVWTRGWWLGASQTAFEKPWQWVTREPLEFTLWGRKEPSASINPPRYLWMADANNDEGTSSWSAQNGSVRGGFLIEWDDPGARKEWQPIFNQAADFGGDLRDVEFRDGATFIKGRTFRAPADPAIVGIRSTMRYLDGDRTGSLMLRSTEAAQFGEEDFALTAFIAPKGGAVVVKMRDRPAGIDQLGRHDYPLSPTLKEGEPFTFELRAENKKIIVSINGHEIGSLDDAWTGATRRFGITPSNTEMTEFRDVAVRRVEGEAR